MHAIDFSINKCPYSAFRASNTKVHNDLSCEINQSWLQFGFIDLLVHIIHAPLILWVQSIIKKYVFILNTKWVW